jgi:hypothetical protein
VLAQSRLFFNIACKTNRNQTQKRYNRTNCNQPATSQQPASNLCQTTKQPNRQKPTSQPANQPTNQLLLVSMEKLVDMLSWFAALLVVWATVIAAIVLGTVVHQMVAVVIACCATALFVRLADYVYQTICPYEQ